MELGHPLSSPVQLGPGPPEGGLVGGTPVLQLGDLLFEDGDILGVGGDVTGYDSKVFSQTTDVVFDVLQCWSQILAQPLPAYRGRGIVRQWQGRILSVILASGMTQNPQGSGEISSQNRALFIYVTNGVYQYGK